MLKIVAILLLSFMILPAFAQTVCTPSGSGTVCTNPASQSSSLPYVPNSGMAKDYFNTLWSKLQSSSQQSGLGNSQFSNITAYAKKGTTSAVDLFSSIKYVIGALMGWIAPAVLGYNLPSWAVPTLVWSMVVLAIWGVWKHIGKLIVTGLIIAIAIFIFLLFGSASVPHL
jgi:hypothetical protein